MEYELVYDAARDFAGWQVVAGTAVVFAFLIVTIYFDQFIPSIVNWLVFHNGYITDWRRATLGVIVILFCAVSAAIINENLKLRSMSKKNECTQIAGVVVDFEGEAKDGQHPQIHGHEESFTLNEIKFKYDTQFMHKGFNIAAADGGPIYEGAKVRLCYIERIENRKKEKTIIRVETASGSIE